MSPTPSTSKQTNFGIIQRFSTTYSGATVTQYESYKTKMRVVVVDQEGPKVNGYFTLATEIHDDSGAPHTLEHLCFLGSKTYRYKGFLDKLATRAYANTNAWTATDHTAYSLDAAGWDGFIQILPIYLEHLILPSLTDAGCYTEVHHIDGLGNDAGVVYSEMQGMESDLEYLMHWKYKRMLYPEGVGFRYETGGRLDQLRTLDVERIREFHRDMYQPRNLCLVIVGAVDHEDLTKVLDGFETSIMGDIPKPDTPFKRPWIESKQAQPLAQSSLETMLFPEEDESTGEIWINFFGPEFNDSLQCGAMVVLLAYLAGSPASVLVNSMVEKEQLASSLSYEIEYRPNVVMQFIISSVATNKLQPVEERFFEILNAVAAKPIDLNYIRDCIRRERGQVKFGAESSARYYAEPIIKDFLFGRRDGSTLQADLENLGNFDTLETWTDARWRDLVRSWLVEAPHATVLGKPSATLFKRLKDEEISRVASQKERLGERGLARLERKLATARAENEIEVPTDLLKRFEIPSTKSIHFIQTTTAMSGAARQMRSLENPTQKLVDQDKDLPLFIHFEHVKSNFAHLSLILGTEVVPLALRPMLALYMANFFSAPMLHQGRVISFEHVIMDLDRDTVGYEIDSGQSMGNSEVIVIKLQVEVEKYRTAIQWFKNLLFHSIFDVGRLKATTTRILAGISDEKRDGEDMMSAVQLMVDRAPSSISRACGTLTRAVYLKRVNSLLKHDPEFIVNKLRGISRALCHASNFRALVIADVERLENPVSSWEVLLDGLEIGSSLMPLDNPLARLSRQGERPGSTAFIVPMPTIDSSYALAVGKGPSSFSHPEIPALMVVISYLNAVEGPLWNAVRGPGLAYGSGFHQHVDSGQISLMMWASPDASKAFVASREAVQDLVSGKTAFDSLALEGVMSSIVLDFANANATMADAAQSSFIRQVIRRLPKDWPSIILEKVRMVNVEEIKQAMRDTVLPIFSPKTSNLFITCAPIMEEKLVAEFWEIGYEAEVKPLAFFQDDYGLKTENGQDGHEDEDEDTDSEMAETGDEEGDDADGNEENEDQDATGDIGSQKTTNRTISGGYRCRTSKVTDGKEQPDIQA